MELVYDPKPDPSKWNPKAFPDSYYLYVVDVHRDKWFPSMHRWCIETFGNDKSRWAFSTDYASRLFKFRSEDDAVLFTLSL